jgi:hypothetical protein
MGAVKSTRELVLSRATSSLSTASPVGGSTRSSVSNCALCIVTATREPRCSDTWCSRKNRPCASRWAVASSAPWKRCATAPVPVGSAGAACGAGVVGIADGGATRPLGGGMGVIDTPLPATGGGAGKRPLLGAEGCSIGTIDTPLPVSGTGAGVRLTGCIEGCAMGCIEGSEGCPDGAGIGVIESPGGGGAIGITVPAG